MKKKFLAYYERIGFQNFMEDVFLEFYKYANVVMYLMPDDRLVVLPIHLCRISNITVNGEPVVEFNCEAVRNDFLSRMKLSIKDFIDDEDVAVRLRGYPPEVAEGVM